MKKILAVVTAIILIGLLIYFRVDVDWENIFSKPNDEVTDTGDEAILHFIDVGQGDSILIEIGDYHILIDAGENHYGDDVVEYLNSVGVDDIEILIGTHADSDHIGGLDDVLNAFEVEKIIDSCYEHSTNTWTDYNNAINDEVSQGAIKVCDSDLVYEITENITLEIYDPGDDFSDINDLSVISMLTVYETKVLLTGDAEIEVENLLLEYDIDADIYKAGHHGSRSSSSTEFLKEVTPSLVIITAGEDNSYGHPHQEAVDRLSAYTDEIYGTWISGDIVITINYEGYTFPEYIKVANEGQAIEGDYDIPDSLTVERGIDAYLEITGKPNTNYDITVNLKSGPSSASGIEEKTSNEDGVVSWTWGVSSNSSVGTYDIVIEEQGTGYKWYITFYIE